MNLNQSTSIANLLHLQPPSREMRRVARSTAGGASILISKYLIKLGKGAKRGRIKRLFEMSYTLPILVLHILKICFKDEFLYNCIERSYRSWSLDSRIHRSKVSTHNKPNIFDKVDRISRRPTFFWRRVTRLDCLHLPAIYCYREDEVVQKNDES